MGAGHGCGDPRGSEHYAIVRSWLPVFLEALDVPHDLSVDGARDAVLELQVHLGDGVLREDGGIGDIT